jgi:citrate synthase
LPTKAQLEEFSAGLKAARALPREVLDVIELVKGAHPMDVLRTGGVGARGRRARRRRQLPAAIVRKGIGLRPQVR